MSFLASVMARRRQSAESTDTSFTTTPKNKITSFDMSPVSHTSGRIRLSPAIGSQSSLIYSGTPERTFKTPERKIPQVFLRSDPINTRSAEAAKQDISVGSEVFLRKRNSRDDGSQERPDKISKKMRPEVVSRNSIGLIENMKKKRNSNNQKEDQVPDEPPRSINEINLQKRPQKSNQLSVVGSAVTAIKRKSMEHAEIRGDIKTMDMPKSIKSLSNFMQRFDQRMRQDKITELHILATRFSQSYVKSWKLQDLIEVFFSPSAHLNSTQLVQTPSPVLDIYEGETKSITSSNENKESVKSLAIKIFKWPDYFDNQSILTTSVCLLETHYLRLSSNVLDLSDLVACLIVLPAIVAKGLCANCKSPEWFFVVAPVEVKFPWGMCFCGLTSDTVFKLET